MKSNGWSLLFVWPIFHPAHFVIMAFIAAAHWHALSAMGFENLFFSDSQLTQVFAAFAAMALFALETYVVFLADSTRTSAPKPRSHAFWPAVFLST